MGDWLQMVSLSTGFLAFVCVYHNSSIREPGSLVAAGQ